MFTEKTPNNHSQDLKKTREELGISLEDLFKRTRVAVVYLQAIENKEFNLLPVPVYSKNFIKIYAHALGLDSEPIIKEYEDYLNARQEQTPQAEEIVSEKFSITKIAGKKIYWIIAFILIAVIVALWLISKQDESSSDIVNPAGITTNVVQENKGQNLNANTSLNQPVKEGPVVAQKEGVKQSPVEEKKTFAGGERNELNTADKKILPPVANIPNSTDKDAGLLSIRAIEDTWLRVKADENPSFQILLKAGEKFEHKAKSFDIDIGNAGGIQIQFKGKNMAKLGESGQVVHLRLP